MKDLSILNSADKKSESYLDDLAFAVCVNGESLEKYKKIVEKKYGTDVYSNMVQFANTLHQQVARRQFTNTSLLSLRLIGKNAGLSEMAIDMIVEHLRSEFREEQLKEEEQKHEDTAFWKQCDPNNKYQLQEYLKKYPTGLFANRAVSLIADLERIEKKAIEESRVFNLCSTQRDYTNYLSKYPNGAYATKAKAIIEDFGRKEIEENRVYNLCKEKKDYLEYLKKYPNGQYAKEAQAKIAQFTEAEASNREETEFWGHCHPDDRHCLQVYLNKYPNGKYAVQARSFIANLDRKEKEAIEDSRMFYQCRTLVDYKDYLRKYPTGQYVKKANEKIKDFDSSSRWERDIHISELEFYKQCKTKDDFLRYLSLYPDGMYVYPAHNKIAHLEKNEKTKNDIKTEQSHEKEDAASEKDEGKENKESDDKYNWICWICGGICAILGFEEGGILYAIGAAALGLWGSAFFIVVAEKVIEKIKG